MTYHTGDKQPAETIDKIVTYRNFDVQADKQLIPGRWHMPYAANELIWSTKPVIGRIFEYRVVS